MPRAWFQVALTAGALIFAVALASCVPPFDPYNRLTGFRVLALIADPPTPAPGETTILSALTYVPGVGAGTASPGLTYAWSWCPFPGSADAGYPCETSPELIAALAAAGITLPSLDLGAGATAQLAHTIDPEALARICAGSGDAGAPPPFDCEGGFPVQIKLTVTSTTGVRDTIVAVSDLRLRFDPATGPNQRPAVDGLAAVKEGIDVPLGAEPALTLPRNTQTEIKAVVPAAASEAYAGRDDDLRPALVHERLTFTWFVETGTTEKERTGYLEGAGSLARNLTNKWTPGLHKDFAHTRARLIVVARDNRGGVGWREAVVGLEEGP